MRAKDRTILGIKKFSSVLYHLENKIHSGLYLPIQPYHDVEMCADL